MAINPDDKEISKQVFLQRLREVREARKHQPEGPQYSRLDIVPDDTGYDFDFGTVNCKN